MLSRCLPVVFIFKVGVSASGESSENAKGLG
jgi:hypothetical protein